MTPNIEYDAPELNLCIPQGNIAVKPDVETVKALNILFGQNTASTAGLTEKVEGGTKILNQPYILFGAMQVGFSYEPDIAKLHVYSLLANAKDVSGAASVKYFYLREKNSQNDPYEFTLENCPNVSELSSSNNKRIYKSRANVSDMVDGAVWDQRVCTVGYDAHGEELYRIYSEQYRYTIADGKAVQTLVPTEPQNPRYIIGFGAFKNASGDSINLNLCYVDNSIGNKTLIPLVSTVQDLQFDFIIPDELFENAPLGYSIYAKGGDGLYYCGPTIMKAKDTITLGSTTLTEQQLIALLELLN